MYNLNRHTIIGRCVKDATLDYVGQQKDIPMSRFSVAVNRPKREGSDTEPPPDYFDVVAWRKDAEYAAVHCKKGTLVLVEGPHQITVKGEGETKKRYAEIVVGNIGSSLTVYQVPKAETGQ